MPLLSGLTADTLTEERIEKRLAALQEYAIMDTPAERAFDNLTYLARFICGTPVSLITLLDRKRQWFKSCQGFDGKELPIELAFCVHAIDQPNITVVPDATLDPRFSSNPLVTGDPKVRFYAGAPLRTSDGIPLGTICVIDRVPHILSIDQQEALSALSEQATQLLELRRTVSLLKSTTVEKQAAVVEAEQLKALLPICSYCKNIRDDHDYWHQVENYFASHNQVRFSHGICPDCMTKFKKELAKTESPATGSHV
jgi:GAF domain-containing protein